MDIELIEKQNDDNYKNELLKKKYTVNSIDSVPEFQEKAYLSKIIVSMSILSLLIGIYILLNKEYYLNSNINFLLYTKLYYYIIIYTLGLIGVLFTSFFLALIIKLISSMKKCLKQKNNEIEKENILIDKEEEESEDDNFLTQILQNADNISMVPYTFSICVLLTIILYVVGFPISWYLIYNLLIDNVYSNYYKFFILYLFIFINSISGAIFIFVLIIFIKSKRKNSLRKLSFTYDEDNLLAVYKEVKDAIDKAK